MHFICNSTDISQNVHDELTLTILLQVVDETVNTDRNRQYLQNLSEMIFGKIDHGYVFLNFDV